MSTVTRVPVARTARTSASSQRVSSAAHPALDARDRVARPVVGMAGQRREHVHLVQLRRARPGQQPQRRGRRDAAVDVAPPVDHLRGEPARDRAGRQHRLADRRRRAALAAEHDAATGVVVHCGHPQRRTGHPAVGGATEPVLQGADHPDQRPHPAAARGQQARRGDHRVDAAGMRHGRGHQPRRADPGQRQRRQAVAGLALDRAHVREVPVVQVGRDVGGRHPALVGEQFVHAHAAAQRRPEHAARAGAEDEVELAERPVQPVGQRAERAGHPGRAEDPACSEDQSDACHDSSPAVRASDSPIDAASTSTSPIASRSAFSP